MCEIYDSQDDHRKEKNNTIHRYYAIYVPTQGAVGSDTLTAFHALYRTIIRQVNADINIKLTQDKCNPSQLYKGR
jgi:hypothetical protein